MIKSNITHSEKRKNLPKTLSCSSSEIHTSVRNTKAACDRKRKVRHQHKWEAVGRGEVYKTPDADNLLLTGPVMPRRSFPPLWLYLSLLHTGLDTSKVSNGEGKYSTHLESILPSSHSENTFQDTCSKQQGKGGEGVSSDPVEQWGHFPSHWQWALGESFTLKNLPNRICSTIIFPTTWKTQGAPEVLEEWLLSGQN